MKLTITGGAGFIGTKLSLTLAKKGYEINILDLRPPQLDGEKEDIIRAYLFALNNPALSGPVNACAPNPVRNKDFVRMLAKAIRRPTFLAVPAFLLKLTLGDMAKVVLASQKVVPLKLLHAGFQFHFTDLEKAFATIFSRNHRAFK